MATQIKPAPKGLYDEDFYVWAQGEANLLRDRRLDELNLDNVEVADLAGAVEAIGPEPDDHDHGASVEASAFARHRSAHWLA